jgi:hypothetical protein
MKKPLIPKNAPSHDTNNDPIHEQDPPIPSQSDEPENPNNPTNVETQIEIVSRQMKALSNNLARVNRSLRFLKKKKTVQFLSARSRRKTPSRESGTSSFNYNPSDKNPEPLNTKDLDQGTSPLKINIDASAQSISVSSQRIQLLQAEDHAQELPMNATEYIREKRMVRIAERLSQNQKKDEPPIKTEASIKAVEKRKESVKNGELPLQGNKPDSLIHHQNEDQNPAATPVLDESPEESDSTSGMKRKKSLRITPPHTPEEQSGPVSDQEPITPLDQGESPMKRQKLNHQDEDQEISTKKQPSMSEKEREESDSQHSTSTESTSSTQDDQDQHPDTIPSLDDFFQQLVAKRGNSLAITSPSTPENMNPPTEYSAITPTVEEKYEQEKDNLLPQKSNADAESSSSAALLRPTRVQHLESWVQIINEHRPRNAKTKTANIFNGITITTRDDDEKSGHSQGASAPEDHDKKSKSLFFLNMRKRYLALIGFLVLFLGSSFSLVVNEQGKVHQQFLLLDAGP